MRVGDALPSLAAGSGVVATVRAELVEAGAPPLTVRAELVEAWAPLASSRIGPHAWIEGGGRESPGRRVTFFRVAERKSPKKGRPYTLRPFASLRATCGARVQRGLARTRSTALRSDNREPLSAGRCAPRRILKGTRGADIHTGHCFAALRSAQPAQREALAPREAERSNGPYGCSAVRLFGSPTPCWLRLRRGGCGVSTRVGARVPRDLTRRGCSNGAAQQRSEFCGAPRNRPDAGCPFAQRRGRRLGVALSLVTFFRRRERKLLARRATPGLRPETRHASKTSAPRLRQAQPERIGAVRTLAQAQPQQAE